MGFLRPAWVILGLTIWAVPGPAKETFRGVDAKWRCYASPHFELFSHATEFESRDLLDRLELLHAVFFDMGKLKERMPLPVSVYFFDDTRDFLAYTPIAVRSEKRTAGFYLRRPDRGVIVVSPQWDADFSRRLIFHEYVHHLTDVAGDNPALWYTEGIAELLSTITTEGKWLKIGLHIPEHVAELQQNRWIPLAALFAVDHASSSYNESERSGMFYAESWAMMHYWYFGDLDLTPAQIRGRDLFFNYIRSEGENGDPAVRERLFRLATGLTYETMQTKLERQMHGGTYRWSKIPRPALPPSSSYAVRPMSRDEIREQLAALDLRINRSSLGKLALLDAIGKNPSDYRALEVLGMDAQMNDDDNEARERWEKALAAGSHNPAIAHELAEIEDRAWLSRFDFDYRMPPATAEHIRQLVHRSLAEAPQQWRGYEILAWVEAAAEKPSIKEINLVQAHMADIPNPDHAWLALAMIRVRFGDFATARQIIEKLRASSQRTTILHPCSVLEDYIKEHAAETEPTDAPAPSSAPAERKSTN